MNDQAAMALGGMALGFGLIVALIGLGMLVAGILFLLNLHKTLAAVAPENRAMEPALVWLNLIPVFSLFWMFWTVIKVSDSLGKEFVARQISDPGEGGKTLGLITCGCAVGSIIPLLGVISSIAALVCWIMYWVKINGYRKQLAA